MVKNEIKLTSQNNQPIKTIIHQDVYAAKETLEKLQSWVSTLELFETFFDERDRDLLNKKEIIQQYHSTSKLFDVFFNDFLKQTNQLESQLETLREREKYRLSQF